MSLCPFATVKLLPESSTQPVIAPRIAILHSAAGRGSLYRFFRDSSNLESHFWVAEDGRIEQYVDTNRRADANLHANGYAVSIETESSPSATERWNPVQAAAIVKLLDWLCTEHPNIKRCQCDSPTGSGIGWHIMFGTPGPWTPVAKSCPGPARIRQVPGIIAAVQRNLTHPTPPPEPEQVLQEDDMARAYRIPNGEVWICTGTHREHVNGTTLNERAVMGLVAPVPADAKDRDDRYPQWVRKTSAQGEKILRKLKAKA